MIAEDQLEQIRDAIRQLQQWNASVKSMDDFLLSPDGMKTLAADCMLIEAIGEGVKKIDNLTNRQLFVHRPEIPWRQIKDMRNHIAHGYFDINTDFVWDVIQNDLQPLLEAIEYFIKNIYTLVPFERN
jgi:uncharacterized protein with HEPN domain